MADDADKAEKAAGHSPAVKVGGVRVVQKKPHRDSEGESKEATADTGSVGMFSASPPKLSMTSGQPHADVATREFPTEAVRHMHEKPKASVDAPRPTQQHQQIHQPRKQ